MSLVSSKPKRIIRGVAKKSATAKAGRILSFKTGNRSADKITAPRRATIQEYAEAYGINVADIKAVARKSGYAW